MSQYCRSSAQHTDLRGPSISSSSFGRRGGTCPRQAARAAAYRTSRPHAEGTRRVAVRLLRGSDGAAPCGLLQHARRAGRQLRAQVGCRRAGATHLWAVRGRAGRGPARRAGGLHSSNMLCVTASAHLAQRMNTVTWVRRPTSGAGTYDVGPHAGIPTDLPRADLAGYECAG